MSWNIACNVVLWLETKRFDSFKMMYQGFDEKYPFWLLKNTGILGKPKTVLHPVLFGMFPKLSCDVIYAEYGWSDVT